MANPPASTTSKKARSLPRWSLGLFVLAPLLLVLTYLLMREWLYEIPRQKAIEQALASHSSLYLNNINRHIANILARIEDVSADPETMAVLKLPPPANQNRERDQARTVDVQDQRERWYYETLNKIPDSDALYLLTLDDTSFPLRGNYVAERLFDLAARGGDPAPRATKLETWRIFIARPVTENDRVAGVLLVELDPADIGNAILANSNHRGQVALIQEVDGFSPSTLLTLGSGQMDQYSITLKTAVDKWKLRFIGDQEMVANVAPSALRFHLTYAGMVIALVLALHLLIQRIAKPAQDSQHRPRHFDPLDDLFTEKFHRYPRGETDSLPAESSPEVSSADIPRDIELPHHVFRDYDIRGKAYSEITGDFADLLGRAVGARVLAKTENCIVVCRDGRKSSPVLKKALVAGIRSTGVDVIDIGEAPTPVMNFALANLGYCSSGVMVTASHNPKEDNGFKIILGGRTLSSDEIETLRGEMKSPRFPTGAGSLESMDFLPGYLEAVAEDILPCTPLKVVVDCGNGVGGVLAPQLLERIGCQVIGLFTDVDGDFPNHPPDPTSPENLGDLLSAVAANRADLGLAIDGDGDRLVAVTGEGCIVWPDELLMVFARDILTRNPGADIIFDVKSTRRLRELISNYGGRPVMWKTGHAHIRNKVRDSKAPLGGEFSGHLFFNDRWFGFDDAFYAAARLIEIMTLREQSLDNILESLPPSFTTPEIKIPVDEDDKYQIINSIARHGRFGDGQLVTIDGVRVEFDHGWGLVRASNTSAALTLRFEADTVDALDEIKSKFRSELHRLEPDLAVDF